jgi:hypothetical protein
MQKPYLLIMLLTCSWVLWQTQFTDTQRTNSPVLGHETREECMNHLRKSMQPSNLAKLTSDGLLQDKAGFLYLYTCLPDTVKP